MNTNIALMLALALLCSAGPKVAADGHMSFINHLGPATEERGASALTACHEWCNNHIIKNKTDYYACYNGCSGAAGGMSLGVTCNQYTLNPQWYSCIVAWYRYRHDQLQMQGYGKTLSLSEHIGPYQMQ